MLGSKFTVELCKVSIILVFFHPLLTLLEATERRRHRRSSRDGHRASYLASYRVPGPQPRKRRVQPCDWRVGLRDRRGVHAGIPRRGLHQSTRGRGRRLVELRTRLDSRRHRHEWSHPREFLRVRRRRDLPGVGRELDPGVLRPRSCGNPLREDRRSGNPHTVVGGSSVVARRADRGRRQLAPVTER